VKIPGIFWVATKKKHSRPSLTATAARLTLGHQTQRLSWKTTHDGSEIQQSDGKVPEICIHPQKLNI